MSRYGNAKDEAPKAPSGDASWPLSGCRADLGERWVHHLHRRGTPREQSRVWVEEDRCRWVKMKVGFRPFARSASSGGGSRGDWRSRPVCRCQWSQSSVKQALGLAHIFAQHQVLWSEEPVSSDNLEGLKMVRRPRTAPGWTVAAGEYGYTDRLLSSHARISRYRCAAGRSFPLRRALRGSCRWPPCAKAHHIDLSAHCAPALHLHAACAAPRFRHQEWFHDHVRIEALLFEGAPVPEKRCHPSGPLAPRRPRASGSKESDAEPYRL